MTGVIAPGVYVLRNVKSGTVLEVKDGWWDNGKVRGWKAGEANNDPDDHVDQRFLITTNPEYNEAVNLLCLRAGAYLTCKPRSTSQKARTYGCCTTDPSSEYDEARSSTQVKTQAVNSQISRCLWIPEHLDGKFCEDRKATFRFRPYDDRKLLLSISGGNRANGAAVVVSPEVLDDGLHQCWKLERTDMDLTGAADWMSNISPQSTKFNMLSIPGTHQSLALNNAGTKFLYSDNPRCQDHSPFLQLCNGIRYLDLRLDLFPLKANENDSQVLSREPNLIARHGNRELWYVWEGYSLSAVLQSLAYFLEMHRGEVVFVSLRIESSANADSDLWVRTLYEELSPWTSYFFYIEDERVFADLSLEDVSGKAILFSDSIRGSNNPIDQVGHFRLPINNVKRFFRSNERQTIIGADGPRGLIPVSQWKSYSKLLTANIANAGRDDDPTHVYRTGLNASGRPGISGIPLGSLYNPVDFFNWLAAHWMPNEIDDQEHPKGLRMGLITMDFYNSAMNYVEFIIERNPGVKLSIRANSKEEDALEGAFPCRSPQ